MPVTPTGVAEIRRRFPSPVQFRHANRGCYCVGGAFLIAVTYPDAAAGDVDAARYCDEGNDELLDCDAAFPIQFDHELIACNPGLAVALAGALPRWAPTRDQSSDTLASEYEYAIRGANDAAPDGDDLALAWALLEDALGHDPATFDRGRMIRLARGVCMQHTIDGPGRLYSDAESERIFARDRAWKAFLAGLESGRALDEPPAPE